MNAARPEPETREASLRKLEERRARDFGTFLDSLAAPELAERASLKLAAFNLEKRG